jgi:ribose/xylose/arabinose/galactoside ABC-type transport system permease subunit
MRTDFVRPAWQALGPVLVLAALCGSLAIIEPRFTTKQNLFNLLLQASPLVLASLAQAIVVISGQIDLSQGAAAALSGVLGVLAAVATGTPWLGWMVVVAASAALAALNGALVAWVRVPAFIATAGMLTYADGLAFLITGGLPIEFPPEGYSLFGRGFIGDLPVAIPFVAVIAVLAHLIMTRTRVGRAIYLVGDNARASDIVGISSSRYRFYAFVMAGVLLGLATLLLTGRIDSAPPGLAPVIQFEAIAAVAIGGIAMNGGDGSIWRAVIGVAPVAVLVNGLNLLGIDTSYQLIVVGAVTIIVVALQMGVGKLGAAS